MTESKMHTKEDLLKDLKNIGVEAGDLLHLKVSMRALGPTEVGAETLLQALLEAVGESGTIVSDAFITVYPLPLSESNKKIIADDYTPSYAGAFANAMIKHPKMVRSKHPVQKFAAIGARAEEFCRAHTEQSGAYELLERMADDDAKNLTIGGQVVGVGTTHIAVEKAGFKRKEANKGVLYKSREGNVKLARINWNGGCGKGFPKFYPLYRQQGAMLNEAKIGDAHSVLTSMKKTLEIEREHLKKDPKFFFCDDPACYSCRISWEHSDKNYFKFYLHWLRKNYKKLNFRKIQYLYKSVFKK